MSKSFSFDNENMSKSLKVFLWTMASAIVALLISLTGAIEMPVEYAFVVPILNTVLYAIKEWLSEQNK